jgi:hypothetical protein
VHRFAAERVSALATGACVATLALSSGAYALTLPQIELRLASALKVQLHQKYGSSEPITMVTCTLAADVRSGHCVAHFTIPAKAIRGVYQMRETLNLVTHTATTKTLSATCTFAKTGKPVTC